jgi:hypothetical protein
MNYSCKAILKPSSKDVINTFWSTYLKKKERKKEKENESRLMRSPCYLCVCLSELYETWYAYHGTCARVSSILNEFYPSVFVLMCISYRLLGNGSVKTLARQEIYTQQ